MVLGAIPRPVVDLRREWRRERDVAFVQLIRASDTASVIEVRIGRTTIQLRPGFDAELLRAVIEVLREVVG
jgi:hypothetical protein